ncbi:hypothetical protein LAZ67_3001587 [Cordylochernes scorpioides]|uniref:Endonuclease/exonuclease/phosphatase domain-containing protein n=1 Tax=Cordylochernes scorpioides TaxID=51811 RepID=A0ABY6K713_9ARAC|nr:hypothetical protein LAZ67_3001587 [Cordylochernes scorpioides]
MATKGLILTLVQEAELLLKDAFKGASLGRPNPTANVPIPSTSFASVVAEKDKPVKPAPPKPKAKSTFVNLAPSFESHVVVRVDGEVRDDEICESFRSNHSVQSLLEKREIRVVHRSNNAAHSTSTVFIEVDNQVAEILGAYIPSGIVTCSNLHPIPLTSPDTAITSIAICLEQSIIVVHSAYWHGLRAADDFIPLLEDTIRRASLPVILGMDTNAHSPTWGIGARLDFRGANLEEFASFNDLHFLGPPVDSTWSNGPLSSSIDVTLASSSLAIHVTRGLSDEMAFTDHIPIWTTFLDMVNNETKSSWVESSCKEQTFKSFINSSLHQNLPLKLYERFVTLTLSTYGEIRLSVQYLLHIVTNGYFHALADKYQDAVGSQGVNLMALLERASEGGLIHLLPVADGSFQSGNILVLCSILHRFHGCFLYETTIGRLQIFEVALFWIRVFNFFLFLKYGNTFVFDCAFTSFVFFWNVTPTQSELSCSLQDTCPRDNNGIPQFLFFLESIIPYIKIGVLDRLRFLPIKKNGSKNLYQILCENEIKCADAFRMLTVAYGEATFGPKQRLSVVQNVLRRPRRCERRRVCRTPEHFNNRRKN